MMRFLRFSILLLSVCIIQSSFGQKSNSENGNRLLLKKWDLKSTVLEKTDGKNISTDNYNKNSWYPVEVPTTVLNGLVKNKVYPDPRIDNNNYLIPDICDSFNVQFQLDKYSYLPNHENPWKSPYWFVTKFQVPKNQKGRQVWLNFDGINYRGEVWLNGSRISDTGKMVGMFRQFKYNVTNVVKYDKVNNLAVKIYPVDHPGYSKPQLEVFGGTRGPNEELFKDMTLKNSGGWDCALPVRDRNMGLYRDVYLSFTDMVDVINPYIQTELLLPDTTKAYLTISATLVNLGNTKQTGKLKGTINLLNDIDMEGYVKHMPGQMKPVTFEKTVEIPANDSVTITLSSSDVKNLTIKNPYLWWPNGYGNQYLHNLKLTFSINGKVSSEKNTMFGIRKVTSDLKELKGDYGKIFYVNGKRIFCKGGWIAPDMLLDNSRKNFYDQARLMAEAYMTVVSSEDIPDPSDDLIESLDKYGIMWWVVFYQCYVIVPGTKDAHNPLDHNLAKQTVKEMIIRYRNHPSITVWCGANESLPDSDMYFDMKAQIKKYDPTRVFMPSTALWWEWEKESPYVKDDMPVGTTDNGEPDYYWYPLQAYFDFVDSVKNNMFHNETGINVVPPYSSLKKFIYNLGNGSKADPLFPLDTVWAEHGAWDYPGYSFKSYDAAIRKYGFKSTNVKDYARIAQFVHGDSYRAIFESAMSRLWEITSGSMVWKVNSSYPEVSWQQYDWYLNPTSAYYFGKKACEPVHIQMNAHNYKVVVINNLSTPLKDIKAKAVVYDFNLNEKWKFEETINVDADSYKNISQVPKLKDISQVYFVKLELSDKKGKVISNNFYWQSKDSLDFSTLVNLERQPAAVKYTVEKKGDEYIVHVKLKNSSNKLSLMNRVEVVNSKNNEEVLPTYWSDNFITLLPGEEREVVARFNKRDLNNAEFKVIIDND